MNPFARAETAITIAVVIIVVGAFLGFRTAWVAPLLGMMLPGLILGGVATTIAVAITKELPSALAVGGVTTVLAIMIRGLFWLGTA